MTAVDLPAHKIVVDGDTPMADLKFLEALEVRRLVEAAVEGRYEVLDRALCTMGAYTGLRQASCARSPGFASTSTAPSCTSWRASSRKTIESEGEAAAVGAARADCRASATGASRRVAVDRSRRRGLRHAIDRESDRANGADAALPASTRRRGARCSVQLSRPTAHSGRRWRARAFRSGQSRRGWVMPISRPRSSTCTTRPQLTTQRSSMPRLASRLPIRLPIRDN